jgi:hypothetical protein
MNRFAFRFEYLFLSLVSVWGVYGACREFYNTAWGTGIWLGEFALSWFILFLVFIFFCLTLLAIAVTALWKPGVFSPFWKFIIPLREKTKAARWLLAILALVFPVYFLQYTVGGVIFQGMYIRSLIWAITVFLFASLITKGDVLIGWNQFLVALILTSGEFMIAAEFVDVSNYPFSLGWSEGNRLWDYSVLFGSDLYLYPQDQSIPVFLDLGRQLVGGLPFIFPGITIGIERFWVALTFILPYFLLGLAVFRAYAKDWKIWLLATLWVFLFLKQGPIHPPLVLSAALTALAWGMPLWAAIPLVFGAGYLVDFSRTTWIFAPMAWIVMMEFSGRSFPEQKKTTKVIWMRSIVLGAVASVFGVSLIFNWSQPILQNATTGEPEISAPAAEPEPSAPPVDDPSAPPEPTLREMVMYLVSLQPMLWYRLLPNSTYQSGILVALVLAITPLLIILAYLLYKKIWQITRLQKLVIFLPLFAFLGVGLVASTKIGGGKDLHNLDMFLISLLFMSVFAWNGGAREWIQNSGAISPPLKIVVALLFVLPALPFLRELYPYNMGEEAPRLVRLADAPNEEALDMLPTPKAVNFALDLIRKEVALAKPKGEILFMDQRQLLTFGYIADVPLVAEYEKKVLMNEALSSSRTTYFPPFYEDLANKRFSLIVTEPLHARRARGSTFQFGEENDDWVRYVSNPLLCYYQPKATMVDIGVQLLVPKDNPGDCSSSLP